ncbi:MAG: zincin-like metallopeptidase domain-containing protein [Bacteroidales bacterium]|jgi:antirestriction protein ArdC|nr:zincin-like metallopeptidase domain-containing protein [Bacteroidales bacterium]
MKTTTETGKGVYDILTDHIINLLEQGTVPWKQPWSQKEPPQNLLNRVPYKGINMMLLSAFNFERNLFLTFNQIKHLSVQLEKGAKSLPVIFWKWPEPEKNQDGSIVKTDDEKKLRPVLRFYSVFNISQIKNLPEQLIPPQDIRQNDSIESCARIVEGMPNRPTIQFVDQEAYYSPSRDTVNVPDIKFFESSEGYYATLFHELIHSTGHEKRLNRAAGMKSISFGSEKYSTEELIAEIGACCLEAQAGISDRDFQNNAAYIKGWLARLKKDSRFIVFASSQAQKAADYILNGHDKELKVAPVLISTGKEVSQKTKKKKIARKKPIS